MRSGASVRPAVTWLAVGGALTAAGLLATVVRTMPAPPHHWPVLAVVAMFALAQLTIVRLDTGLTFTLLEVPMVIGLIALPPTVFVAAWVVSGLATLGLVRRQPLVQLAFNLSSFALEAVLSVVVFRALSDGRHLVSGRTLAALLVATALSATLSFGLVRTAENGRVHLEDLRGALLGLGASVTVSAVVLVGVVIEQTDPTLLWLLALPVAGVAWAARRVSTPLRHLGSGDGTPPSLHMDVTTGLPDQEEFSYEFSRAQAAHDGIACLLISLDGAAGTGADDGEALTVVAAQRVAGCLRSGDLATRLGPHSLVVLAHVNPGAARAEASAVHRRVGAALERPARIGDTTLAMKARLGMVVPRPGDSAADVLAAASRAMRRRSEGDGLVAARSGAAPAQQTTP